MLNHNLTLSLLHRRRELRLYPLQGFNSLLTLALKLNNPALFCHRQRWDKTILIRFRILLLNGSQLCFCISRGLLCALGNRDKLGSHFIQNRLAGLLVALRGLLNNFRLRVSVVIIATRLIFSVGGIGRVIRIVFGLVIAFLGIFRLIGIFALIRIFVGIVLVGRGLFIPAGTIFAAIKVSC